MVKNDWNHVESHIDLKVFPYLRTPLASFPDTHTPLSNLSITDEFLGGECE